MGGPVRVLHVVVNMNLGGAETLLMNLYRNIDRSQVQFDFLTCKEGVFDSEIEKLGGKVHRIPYITEVGPRGFDRKLQQFLTANPEYKIIHSHLDKMSGIVLKSAKKAHVPVRIAHSHNTGSEGGALSKMYKWYAGSYVKSNATHLYACSLAAAKWLFGEKSGQALILKNGIEMDKFQYSPSKRAQIREHLQIGDDTLVLGHVGRFAQQKNHHFLLEIFADVNKRKPDSILLLAGGGPLQLQVEQKIRELNLGDSVRILGIRDDIHLLLQAFDMFVFPSLHEGLPVTLIEAQGAGLPCVISDTITREVDMGIGLVRQLPITDKQIWSDHIIDLAENKPSRAIASAALSEQGYDIRKTARHTQLSYLSLGETVI